MRALLLGCALALAPLPISTQPAHAAPPGDVFTVARLRYRGGGDWYSNPSSLPNLLAAAHERLGLRVAESEAAVAPADEDLFNYPFLYMNGHGRVVFSDAEASRLRRYLTSGGFLFADDNYGMDETFRPAIRKVFPDKELVEVPFSHAIYHGPYDFPHGLPKIHEHHGGPPQGLGIFHEGRLVVFYSYNTDIGDGLEDPEVHNDPADKREAALQMALNVVHYALTH